MDTYPRLKKCLVVGIIVLFIGIAVAPSINPKIPITDNVTSATIALNITTYNGTLSGYITDSEMNPIEGAMVRVYFHNTYRENYSNATGYFHVTDISICNCTKNATCSKEGYNPAWVYLGIWENTTYDFVLTSKGNWLYVGGSGPGNYTRMQDAIDNASNGDTVYVYAGRYLGNIVINVSIDLIGENKNTTIIDNNTDIEDPQRIEANIYIFADSVNITRFTIQNCRGGVGIFLDSSYIHITGNIFYNNSHGIHFYGISPSHVYISKNIFLNNYCGIYPFGKNCNISENNIINNDFGIRIFDAVNNTICNNNIESNRQCGILVFENSKFNYIHKNNFINNTKSAYFNWFSFQNKWDGNFWNEPRDKPVIIYGSIGLVFIPCINVDWHPAQEPYDISW